MLRRIINKLMRILVQKNGKNNLIYGEVPKNIIKAFLPDDAVIVDAGAHDGRDTVELSKLFPKGKIYAFEPIPEIFSELKENTKHLNNVTCYPLALSDKIGTVDIFVSSGQSTGSSSLLPPKEHITYHPNVEFLKKIKVATTTLDAWAEKNLVQRIDFLWLDMQGYELAMCQASPHILKTVQVVYTEVSLKEVYEGVPLYPEVRQWFEKNGFRMEREELAWAEMGNVLFVRN